MARYESIKFLISAALAASLVHRTATWFVAAHPATKNAPQRLTTALANAAITATAVFVVVLLNDYHLRLFGLSHSWFLDYKLLKLI